MTEPFTPPVEPHEGLKADANPEARAVEEDQSSYVARGGNSSGIVGSGPAPGDEQPSQAKEGGTAGGGALDGVTMSEQDSADTVDGDTGPEHPGVRRST